ncbi:uncharacterized protein TRAVEDRAFT_28025 [Trametes versicolor FP-101664 SS1]|uniref:uncharacterized protein n=1 Tax=Trametes versicolor (strain FP-101664) TaxID=717944 RepID=UPI00046214AF|nr:uncharacterized protein TRAVEDRAFT_28025 [Trametes versicolor FP-101664 SS1]EIW60462.1 hypothetical protein TRAVEDRAFT_28025 [Trametes versicolor FP-101664 SS1]
MQLSNKFRAELHVFKEFVLDLDPMHWRVIVVQQASVYKSLDQQEEILKAIAEVKEDGKQVQSQIAKRFAVDKDMNDDILTLCKQLVVEGLRDEYDIADEALEMLKDRAAYPRFAQVWNSASKIKLVVSAVRTQGSYVRREYRGLLVNTTTNPLKKCGLTACVREYVRKFSRTAKITHELVIWVAILRQFIRDNRDLVSLPDDADGPVVDAEEQPQANGRKRKRTAGGRPARSFWGEFKEWVKEKKSEDEWTDNFCSVGWIAHIEDCLEQERRDFPDDQLALVPQRFQSTSRSQIEAAPTSHPSADRGLGLASSGVGNFLLHPTVQPHAQSSATDDLASDVVTEQRSDSSELPPMHALSMSSRSTTSSWTPSPRSRVQSPLPADELPTGGSAGTSQTLSYVPRVPPQHDHPVGSSLLGGSLPRMSVGDSSHSRLEEFNSSSRFPAAESRAQFPGLPGFSALVNEAPGARLPSLASPTRPSASFAPPHFHAASTSTPGPHRSDHSQRSPLSQYGGHAATQASSSTSGPRGPSLHGAFQSWSGASTYGR